MVSDRAPAFPICFGIWVALIGRRLKQSGSTREDLRLRRVDRRQFVTGQGLTATGIILPGVCFAQMDQRPSITHALQ